MTRSTESLGEWLLQYKLQPQRHLSTAEFQDLILLTSFNMLLVSVAFCCPFFEFLWSLVCGMDRLSEIDDWDYRSELLFKLPIHTILTEAAFYAFHHILHQSAFLYQRIHKIHHRFTAPTAMACVYAHPLEFALANVGAIYMGPICTNAHPWTCYLWFILAMVGTCKGHNQIFRHRDYHDIHHRYAWKQANLGALYVSDLLLGTLHHPSGEKG
eukprot:CAMPEP_0168793600 /NCGR_PEP_ID=MMETSP0725-20121227/15170_1 /TAXON_ID=265536 /ORGANISM="Amphiprora sp., Strain CCMP467" /LENGTH=212 /DNA_ID=CAMNT_0008844383 /DNA_START=40 /DNA_END=678 /DNA_ORIENTATION=+